MLFPNVFISKGWWSDHVVSQYEDHGLTLRLAYIVYRWFFSGLAHQTWLGNIIELFYYILGEFITIMFGDDLFKIKVNIGKQKVKFARQTSNIEGYCFTGSHS